MFYQFEKSAEAARKTIIMLQGAIIKDLSEAGDELADLKALGSRTNLIASHTGALEAYTIADRMTENGERDGIDSETIAKEIARVLLREMSRGADDKWSGRGNDLARSRYDGFLDAAREIASR